jgi:hypothetical protein
VSGYRKWTPEQDSMILDLRARGYSVDAIAMLHPDMTPKSIYGRLAQINGGRITPVDAGWNEGRIARAMELLASGANSQVAADKLNTSRSCLAGLIRRLRASNDPRLPAAWRIAKPRGITHDKGKAIHRVSVTAEPLPPRLDRPTFPCLCCGAPGWCGHAGRVQPWKVAA